MDDDERSEAERKENKMEEENKKEKKNKKYHSTRSGLTRIIALILALIMCFAATASLIFMLIG